MKRGRAALRLAAALGQSAAGGGGRAAGAAAVGPAAGLSTSSAGAAIFGTGSRAPAVGGRLQRGGGGAAAAAGAALAVPAGARAAALPAAVPREGEPEPALPRLRVDAVGAVSMLAPGESADFVPRVYENVDGRRIEDGRYAAFIKDLSEFIPSSRQFTDPVRTFAYGTDASFYRLNPKLVVKVHSEDEIRRVLPLARKHRVPVTFRAAGTSLSGQALTDSVLLKLSHTGKNFRNFTVHGDGSTVTVEPGLIGGEVNRILAAHKRARGEAVQYKIGPDPSSIDSCMMGGIVANNSSGMCCGVSQNTYHTLRDMRVVFADGTVLDTADEASRAAFLKSHAPLVEGVAALARRVQADKQLASLIRRKFAIKCTTGYSLNALVDFPADEPIEIIKRLMVGSEGTLGFVSRATYNTVPEWPHKASAFVLFPDIKSACEAASVLRSETSVDAVEMFDRASLRECASNERMTELVPDIVASGPLGASLLIECRGQTADDLTARIAEVHGALRASGLPFGPAPGVTAPLEQYEFKHEPRDFNVYWDVRKGLIPIVGGAREDGTSMLLEDVACPVDKLGDMTMDLIEMFQRHGYHDASAFGHALEGNLHLVFCQGFRTPEEVKRFHEMMDEMCYIVATKYSGSLKGEHSTGRNMAPYVELEWGTKATQLMWEIKALFDPANVLNPGVILSPDPLLHVRHLKPSPPANKLVNRCIECGFCESNCPSRDLTITPRQRIAVYKELYRLRSMDARTEAQQARLDEMAKIFEYDGKDTCAADGMCQEKCPVKINTGELIKELRVADLDAAPRASAAAAAVARNFGGAAWAANKLLSAVSLAHGVLGAAPLRAISGALNRLSGHLVPEWNPHMPRGAPALAAPAPPAGGPVADAGIPRKVVYLPACVTRIMGPSRGDPDQSAPHQRLLSLLSKARYEVVYPEGLSNLCCGMMFNTRGLKGVAAGKASQLEAALLKASEGGKYPIVCDTSPCLSTIKGALTDPALRFSLYEPTEFARRFLADKLDFKKVKGSVAVHVPCSSKKMGIEASFLELAGRCAETVVPSGVPCCGMAGDRGMRYPELTAASLAHLQTAGCSDGYSTSRTCEMSLSNHSGVHFRGLVHLLDEAASPKADGGQQQQQQQQRAATA